MLARQVQGIAWGLSGVVVIVAVVAWGQSYQWQFADMSIYQIFPLFGLLAFSLMWTHYIVSALRQYMGLEFTFLTKYFEITSLIVLCAILIHPGLLAWQLWRDGLGLPPGSTKMYVGATSYWAIWLAVTAWTLFLAYELRRVFGNKKWWPLVQYASDAAMVLVFIHALRLGGAFSLDWFRFVWFFYGFSFGMALLYGYSRKYRKNH